MHAEERFRWMVAQCIDIFVMRRDAIDKKKK